ncbi:uncharacterized protein A4U43_C04F14630 [Asparagus officinalis]|uniref:Peroxidase n=1 Tax=Asparagus officinalis TaxID=4686 RepID=A0A5P1F1D7_ASPOF|nr:peroxidase 60-like [Asparagus officinalis]ONK72002.1 uncharacterized protein A4U43_C04F14630 [Asparagus officinalis]
MKATLITMILLILAFTVASQGPLQVGFYKGKCGSIDIESIIGGIVHSRFVKDPTVVAALLRMQFHDCFVNGCDASLLLDGESSEKTAPPNLSVRGYDIIDEVKTVLEKACPRIVSCADIIIAATRDAIAFAGGSRYKVQMGRRDGKVSLASNVDLPNPTIPVDQSITAFQKKGLSVTDMVLLLGGHTVGIAHCSLFSDRLYNFNGTGSPDPAMDSGLVSALKLRCPQKSKVDNTVNLDQNSQSSNTVDNSFYKQILMNRGILKIDQSIALDNKTRDIVSSIANAFNFTSQFSNAMIKMGAIQVLTGANGEIRKSCKAVNTS